jgi:hypothetical protein
MNATTTTIGASKMSVLCGEDCCADDEEEDEASWVVEGATVPGAPALGPTA